MLTYKKYFFQISTYELEILTNYFIPISTHYLDIPTF